MTELSLNTVIELTNGKVCRVKKEIGRGGQGIVYLVEYDNSDYAFKWYIIDYSSQFYANLEKNIEMGAPNQSFLWPLAISKRQYGSFGYIMKLRPNGYAEVGSFMLAKTRFVSVEATIEACLQICSAFQRLHILGLSYQDMNDGNFFINPKTGDVLICDNDNVAPNKINTGIVGKNGYMAPEIVDKESMPDRYSDYFSLGVVLFILIYLNRPFEGKKVLACPCQTDEAERKLFGKDSVFIMDPLNDTNRPVPHLHRNIMRRWALFPRLLRETFIKAFNREAIIDPTKRVMDKEWQQVFLQIRSQYVECPHCNKKTFIEPEAPTSRCVMCRKHINRPLILRVGNYRIPLLPNQRIYKCQAYSSMNVDLSMVYAEVSINNKTARMGLRNISRETWAVTLPNGQIRNVEDGRGLPAIPDLKIKFNNITALITL